MEDEPGNPIRIRIAVAADFKYVYPILEEMERSARARGTGIARRSPQSLCQKIHEGKAVIAVATKGAGNGIAGNAANGAADEEWAGFSYIETWGDGAFISNSGLIVNPVYRGAGVATAIKQEIFALSRRRYPGARIFSITTGAAVMKLNHKLGFEPVTYAEITRDATFWDQCRHCVNYSILESKQRQQCLCTAMLFTPERTDSRASRAIGSEERVAGKVEFSI